VDNFSAAVDFFGEKRPFFLDSIGEQMVELEIRSRAKRLCSGRSLTKEAASKREPLVFGKTAQNLGSSWVTLGQIGST
jgi:hypothetical protein